MIRGITSCRDEKCLDVAAAAAAAVYSRQRTKHFFVCVTRDKTKKNYHTPLIDFSVGNKTRT